MELRKIIKEFSALSAPSGSETPAAERIKELLDPLVDEMKTDAMGNLIGVKKCGIEGAPRVLLDAHMDEVGFIVTEAVEGFLKFATIGGVDARMLPGREVTVLADEPLYGVIACLPPHVLSAEEREQAIKVKDLYIDIGCSQEEAEKRVPPGTYGVFRGDAFDLGSDYICGKAMDDRMCVAMLLKVMENLKDVKLNYDLYFMASVQEELGCRGAEAAAFGIAPDYCIAVDVTFASTPDYSGADTFKAGCGAVITVGPNVNRRMSDALMSYCKEKEIGYKIEVAPRHSGTNAWPIQVSREGVCTGILSVPLKYMHSPVEIVKLSDAETGVELLTGFLRDYFERGVIHA
ncbi:MAG: M20/M25/M40 family metallo-hydrolase [Clostridiales bacterium]|nr:M20/M25/M40 family metallo-hydrolase [Clostridiales bacterium]